MKLHLLLLALSSCLVLRAPAQSPEVLPDPGTMRAFANNPTKTFHFEVVGTTRGVIYGSGGIYTTDSSVACAAVHAGVLRPGERGVVACEIYPGQRKYVGTRSNGVTSGSWGAYLTSFRITRSAEKPGARPPSAAEIDARAEAAVAKDKAPANLAAFKADAGEMSFLLKGDKDAGDVWGTDVYTADSSLAAAAVHAGVLPHNAMSKIRVRMLPGRASFSGTARNGVSSKDYGPWDVAFEFVKP